MLILIRASIAESLQLNAAGLSKKVTDDSASTFAPLELQVLFYILDTMLNSSYGIFSNLFYRLSSVIE